MLQVGWYCDKCKENHFGNCPILPVTMTATGFDRSESSGEPPTLRKLAPVSPNTTIEELLTRDGITELVDYPGGKVIRIKPSVIQEAEALISATKKEQSAKTSRWIEENILLMQKDKAFRETSGSVALTYAADQARQGRYKALKEKQ